MRIKIGVLSIAAIAEAPSALAVTATVVQGVLNNLGQNVYDQNAKRRCYGYIQRLREIGR
jgi:hypothetical protein